MNIDIYQLLTALGAFVGTLTGVYALIQQRKKTMAEAKKAGAEAADIIQEASKDLIDQYKARVIELLEETRNLKVTILELNTEIATLKAEVLSLRTEIDRLRKFENRREREAQKEKKEESE